MIKKIKFQIITHCKKQTTNIFLFFMSLKRHILKCSMNFHLDDPHLDDLGEEDEELLAELLALQGEEAVIKPKSKQQGL